MQFSVSSSLDGGTTLFVPVLHDSDFTSLLPDELSSYLRALLDGGHFVPRFGRIACLYDVCGFERIVFIGLGSAQGLSVSGLRKIGAHMVRYLQQYSFDGCSIYCEGILLLNQRYGFIFEGILLRNEVMVQKNTASMEKLADALIKRVCFIGAIDEERLARHQILAEGTALARRLTALDPAALGVEGFCDQINLSISDIDTLHVTYHGKEDLASMGANLFLAVNRGSAVEPRMAEVSYCPRGLDNEDPIVLVGKGIVFDTGGINVKPDASMKDMKKDMSGAAVVFATLLTLARLGVKKRVICLLGLTDNAVSATSYLPSEILTSAKGLTVEVAHTDAEGRLVLADMLHFADRFSPSLVIDVATLTGSIITALGHGLAGIFSNDEKLALELRLAGLEVDENSWHMPVDRSHKKMIASKVADIKNLGDGSKGGSSSAAAFLERFVPEGASWAHIDIAGTALDTPGLLTSPEGYTGYGVGLLVSYLEK